MLARLAAVYWTAQKGALPTSQTRFRPNPRVRGAASRRAPSSRSRYVAHTCRTFPAPGHGFAKTARQLPRPVGATARVPIRARTRDDVPRDSRGPEAFSVADSGSPLASSPFAGGFYLPRRCAPAPPRRTGSPHLSGKSQRKVLFCSRAVLPAWTCTFATRRFSRPRPQGDWYERVRLLVGILYSNEGCGAPPHRPSPLCIESRIFQKRRGGPRAWQRCGNDGAPRRRLH